MRSILFKIPPGFRSAPLGGTKGTKGFLSKKHIFYNQIPEGFNLFIHFFSTG